jgi:SAM-dependent methyltransferase
MSTRPRADPEQNGRANDAARHDEVADLEQDPAYAGYLTSHHGHRVLAPSRRLTDIEFQANFLSSLPPPPARILELGFGTGATLERLAAIGYRDLEGWDVSGECVARARGKNLPARLRHLDAISALPAEPPEVYDAVIAKDLLEHLPRDGVLDFVRGLHHVLKPGGVFVARLPNMANPFSVFLRYDDFTHRLGFTENSLLQVFTLGGFDRERVLVNSDILPGTALLKAGLLRAFVREKITGPVVRWIVRAALRSQRKGPPRVDTLRAIVVARKGPSPTKAVLPE